MKGILNLSNKIIPAEPSKWDIRYLELAKQLSSWSKDPSSKIGAVAIGDKGQVLSCGYNGFPRNIVDRPDRLNNREEKYNYIVHAEMNVIYNASYNGVSLDNSTMYVYGLPVCKSCSLGVVQVGVSRVVMPHQKITDRWLDSWIQSRRIFKEAGVKWDFVKYDGYNQSDIEYTEES